MEEKTICRIIHFVTPRRYFPFRLLSLHFLLCNEAIVECLKTMNALNAKWDDVKMHSSRVEKK